MTRWQWHCRHCCKDFGRRDRCLRHDDASDANPEGTSDRPKKSDQLDRSPRGRANARNDGGDDRARYQNGAGVYAVS